MATWRIILKKTTLFEKGRVAAHSGREFKRYLARYVDEVGKAATKAGEGPGRSAAGDEPRWLLPEESTGVLWSGGFLGDSASPGMAQPSKQLGWCRRVADLWVSKLNGKTRRRNDGFRFVMSLGQKAVEDLTASGISTDQAMRAIWEGAVDLYRQRHGWDRPGGELGWVAGAHHDTDNTHMHLVVFPTTLDGQPLRTNFRGVGANKIDDLNDLIAMCNISAEIFWREHLGLEYQSEEYRLKVAENPEAEPPLPEVSQFRKNARVERPIRSGGRRPPVPDLKVGALGREAAEEIRLALGADRPGGVSGGGSAGRRTSKAIRRLSSYIATLETYGEKRKVKFWDLFRLMETKPAEAAKSLEEDFPEEAEALKNLEKSIRAGQRKPERRLVAAWAKRGREWARALLAAVVGMPENPDRKHLRAQGLLAASGYEKTFKAIPADRLPSIWGIGTGLGREAARMRHDAARYRAVLRGMRQRDPRESEAGPETGASSAQTLMSAILRGASRLMETLDARKAETRSAILRGRGKAWTLRETGREWSWSIKDKDIVPQPSKGRPWPLHLDPELVFEELKKEEIPVPARKKRKIEEIQETVSEKKKSPEETVLERLIRVVSPRRARRRALARERIELEGPELR